MTDQNIQEDWTEWQGDLIRRHGQTPKPEEPKTWDTSKIPSRQKPKARRGDPRIADHAKYIGHTLEVVAWIILISGIIYGFILSGHAANGKLVTFGGLPYSSGELQQIAVWSLVVSFLVFVWFHFLSNISAYIRFKTEK